MSMYTALHVNCLYGATMILWSTGNLLVENSQLNVWMCGHLPIPWPHKAPHKCHGRQHVNKRYTIRFNSHLIVEVEFFKVHCRLGGIVEECGASEVPQLLVSKVIVDDSVNERAFLWGPESSESLPLLRRGCS